MKQVSRNLYRGKRPTIQELKENQITFTVCFQSGFYELLHEDDYERVWGNRVNIKCPAIKPPSVDNMHLAMETVERLLKEGERVLFHCAEGCDRTGVFAYLWNRKHNGWTHERALKDMLDNGFHVFRFWWWLFDLRYYEQFMEGLNET